MATPKLTRLLVRDQVIMGQVTSTYGGKPPKVLNKSNSTLQFETGKKVFVEPRKVPEEFAGETF